MIPSSLIELFVSLARHGRIVPPSIVLAGSFAGANLAQEAGGLNGRVFYGRGGPSVPGAHIVLPNLGFEAVTDDEGSFHFVAVPPGEHAVVVELLGCSWTSRRVEIQPQTDTELTFILGGRAVSLDGLMVAGIASELSAAEQPFTVDALEGANLRAESARSLGGLIQGRFAGGRVVQGSGLPGEEAQILLQAPTSIRGSEQPLVVIDGMIAGHGTAGIDPMDVERVEVLKGAAAAALYGSRGQAGVIEITTKQASARPTQGEQHPVLIVDAMIREGRLADLDVGEIVDIQMLRGPAAVLVAGSRGEAGVIGVTTRAGMEEREGMCPLPPVP